MAKLKKCTVCGKEFLSTYGKEICSDECRIIRKKEQDNKGNHRRRNGTSGTFETIVCSHCGQEFEGLNRRYCPSCSDAARTHSQRQNYKNWYKENKKKKK